MMKYAALMTGHDGRLASKTQNEHELTLTARLDNFLRGVERRAFVMARVATQDEEEALDIVQDAMFKLVQKYSSHDEAEWGALFHSILHSRINDWHRRQTVRNRWRVFFFRGEEDEGEIVVEELVAQTQFLEPERQVLQDEMSAMVQVMIGQLPLRQQQALLLRAWEGYDIAETATIMNCSQGSVKTHYSRAIHSLRKKLEE
jgi:RNA polymerase sigma-70 factor (ECF subfamily)